MFKKMLKKPKQQQKGFLVNANRGEFKSIVCIVRNSSLFLMYRTLIDTLHCRTFNKKIQKLQTDNQTKITDFTEQI